MRRGVELPGLFLPWRWRQQVPAAHLCLYSSLEQLKHWQFLWGATPYGFAYSDRRFGGNFFSSFSGSKIPRRRWLYQCERRHIPVYISLCQYLCENLKYHLNQTNSLHFVCPQFYTKVHCLISVNLSLNFTAFLRYFPQSRPRVLAARMP